MWRVRAALVIALASSLFAAEIDSPACTHKLKLDSLFVPQHPPIGLLLKASIDNGPILRLLLDSGAQYLVLDRNAAIRSGLGRGSNLDLVGTGPDLAQATMVQAATVDIADLSFRNCTVLIAERKLTDGIDGVIPLSMFAGYLLRLDIPGHTLHLQPYPSSQEPVGGLHAVTSGGLLFLKAVLNSSQEGLVLLDTGASSSAISLHAAQGLKSFSPFAADIRLMGGTGQVEARSFDSELRFRLGSTVLQTNQAVVLGLHQMELHHKLSVTGILGYSALRNSVLNVNYRDLLVGIEHK